MLDLVQMNKDMLNKKLYNILDTRQMLKISALKEVNDYDLYLIACCLCNYPTDTPEEKAELRDLRMKYFTSTGGSIIGYEHTESDYIKVVTDIKCVKNDDNLNISINVVATAAT